MSPASTSRRGRPPRLSREHVLRAALDLAEREGPQAVTMAAVGQAVGASPMALYRHVDNRDDLLDGVIGELLSGLRTGITPELGWQESVARWMTGVRAHFIAHPGAVRILGNRETIHPEWMRIVGELIEPLGRAGIPTRDVVRALLWVSRVTMGILLQEVKAPVDDHAPVRRGVAGLSDEEARAWQPLLVHLERLDDDDLFSLTISETIHSLERWTRPSAARP